MVIHHWKNGWNFIRESDGTVTIKNGENGDSIQIEFNIPADEWASIVAAVSEKGEAEGRWQAARAFHAGET